MTKIDPTQKVTAHDMGDDGLVVNYYQDVEPVLDLCARERREDRERTHFQKRGEFRRTMVVPLNILMKIREERGLDFLNPEHSKAVVKLLKTSEYAYFRTVNDKI